MKSAQRPSLLRLRRLALAGLACLPAAPAAAFQKGVASAVYLGGPPVAPQLLYNLNPTWIYNWAASTSTNTGPMEFVPMLWGSGSVTAPTIAALTAGQASGLYRWLLGFNEPDNSGQANMTPAQAVALWPQLQSTGLALVSPAPSWPTAPSQTNPSLTWLQDFMAQAKAAGYRVDAVAFHAYLDYSNPAGSVTQLKSWCQQVYTQFGKPLWITEIGAIEFGTPSTTPTQELANTYMEQALSTLSSLTYVARVAWFTDNCACAVTANGYHGSLYTGNNTLNSIGQIYKDYPAQAVPGRVQAEDYTAFGSTGLGSNPGGVYRLDPVGIEATSDAGGGWDVGWISPGEWLNYQINVSAAGGYDLGLRLASGQAGPLPIQLSLDGAPFGPLVNAPGTGGWQTWTTVVVPGLTLPAGTHTLGVSFTAGGVNFNYLDLAPHHAAPGRVQAEDYSNYADSTVGNAGMAYRFEDADVEACTDVGGGYDLGYLAPGEWVEFPLSVSTTGAYDAGLRVASGASGGSLQLLLDGASLGPSINVPATGGWQTWASVTRTGLALAAGQHFLRVSFTAGSFNVNYLDLVLQGTPTPSFTPSPLVSATTTGTASPTGTATPTATPSPTATQSWTAGPSATLTSTPSLSPTRSPCPTVSPTAGPGSSADGVLRQVRALPNPNPGALAVELSGPAQGLRLDLYTAAYVKVGAWAYPAAPAGWSRLPLPPDLEGLASGLYFYRLRTLPLDAPGLRGRLVRLR